MNKEIGEAVILVTFLGGFLWYSINVGNTWMSVFFGIMLVFEIITLSHAMQS